MLKGMRKKTKLVIWTVIISFALWGGFSVGVQFQKQGRVAGEIFGKEITFQEYNQFYKSQQIFSFSGSQAAKDPEALKQQTWESLLYSKEAQRLKINVSDDEVRNEILRLMAQQKIQNPDLQFYQRWLQATVKEPAQEFEAQIRELLRIQKLIQKVRMENKMKPATEQEAHEKFTREQNQLSAETLSFKTEEEAKQFFAKAKNAGAWKKEVQKQKLSPRQTGLMTLAAWIDLWGIPEKEALALLQAEKDAIRGPVALQNHTWMVLKIAEKKKAAEEDFQKTFKQKYMQEINDRRSYENFLIWHQGLLLRAKPKDYLPGSPAPAVPAPPAK